MALAPIVRKLLAADAAFEAIVGFVLLGLIGRPHVWLDVSRPVVLIASGVFFVATVAIALAALNRSTSRAFVSQLSFANIAGGAVLWAFTVFGWDRFTAEGRWLLAATADAFILLGILEVLALRRTSENA